MITRPRRPAGQSSPGRPAHRFTLVENRPAFLKDRARRDKEHAQRVRQDGHAKVVQVQAQTFQDKLSESEGNAAIRKIRKEMESRSPRVAIPPPSEIR